MSVSTLPRRVAPVTPVPGHPVLDVVIPVHNEQTDLEPCVRRLHEHLDAAFPYAFRITVADNASTDSTAEVARRLAAELPHVTVVRLPQKGRGRALRQTWSASDAPVLAYMDVDLSTDLAALLPLVAPLLSGHSDLAIGTRLSRGSRVVRGAKREVISRCYNLLLRSTLSARFSDAQCGFKAIRADVAARLLPMVEDAGWFFDTELLVLAERAGLRIHEVPVDWVDDPDSRVDIVATALADLRGVARLGRALATGRLPLAALREQLGRQRLDQPVSGVPAGMIGQLLRFAGIGIASTCAYLLLYALLRGVLGAQAANLVALLSTAVANTAVNRRLTFGVRGPDRAWRHQAQGLVIFALGLALTTPMVGGPAGWAALLTPLVATYGAGDPGADRRRVARRGRRDDDLRGVVCAVRRPGRRPTRPGSGRSQVSTDAIVLLKEDHKEVRQLFKEFQAAGENATARKKKLVGRIIEALTVHTYIENEVMYPEVRRLLPDLTDDVLESYEEHHVVDVLCAELAEMEPDHERYDAKVTVLMENVEHHVEEEEQEWFPKVRDGLGRKELQEMGARMLAAREKAPRTPAEAQQAGVTA